jgi:hemerythrin-like metal-binding protein
MALMKWDATLSVSVPSLDAQHQRLIALVNSLHDAMRAGQGAATLGTVLDELLSYTRTHFMNEEMLMKSRRYPGLDAHVAEHRALIADVQKLQAELKSGTLLTMTVMEFLQAWLMKHILQSDKQYVPYLNKVA